jgi:hypothetical protein
MGGDDLVVPAGSTLTISSSDAAGSAILLLSTASTGTINGTVNITGGGSRLACQNTDPLGSLFFQSGATANVNVVLASSYPFGGSSSQTASKAIVFKSGSSLVFQGGNSFFGGTSTFNPISFEAGSTAYFDANASSVSNFFNSRTYANVTLRNASTVTLSDNFYNIDNLTINAGCTMNLRTTGTAPIAGNIVNNGTFGGAAGFTTTHLVLDGTTPQSVSGSGTYGGFGAVSVATNADVTLNANLTIGAVGSPTSTISGKLNMQNRTIGGTGALTLRTAQTVSSIPATLSSNNSVLVNNTYYSSSVNTANIAIGMLVTGTGIQPNTYIVATSSSTSTFTISKPATVTTATDGTSLTITGFSPTLQTANTGGADGSIITSGTKSYGSGVNYIFDAATTTPLSTTNSATAGNLTFNAAATLNRSVDITGTLTLNSGKLVLPPAIAARIMSGNAIGGGPFSSSKYIVTQVNTTTGDQAGLKIDGFSSARLFPVGSDNNYLPITLTPVSASDFVVAAFEGITNDGTPNGTAMTAGQKAEVVDAVWTINRISANTDNCDVTLNWVSSLEGSTFSTFSNSQVGVARYNGTSWSVVGGSGDNTANFATNTFNAFSPFGVGKAGVVLPLKFLNFNAVLSNNKVALQWNVQNELGLDKYIVERSSDGTHFNPVTNVTSKNQLVSQYNFVDPQALSGIAYYRIKSVGANGQANYTGIVKVSGNLSTQLEVYPNPVRGNIINLSFKPTTGGSFSMILVNRAGQQVLTKSLGQVQNNFNSSIVLPDNILPGVYTLIVRSNETELMRTILIQ